MFRITMVILLVMNLFTIGCAVTMPTAIIEQPKSVTTEDITAAAVVALQEHEYSVSTVNDRIGIVNTDWKDITSVGSKLLQASLTGTISHTRMKITITVNKIV